ncbi:hypothetical protein [Fredinandcohnia sp. FSL W7-1320]|uniref:hypothetical protein n=1 Tax=Fredinandcohnia sp. FSL W7-1320 TaxID=2954540 RepID=UPI0030FD9DE0
MKKSLITLIVLVLLGVGIYFIIGLFNTNPTEPTITVEGKKVEVAQGSYCWDRLLNSVCADTSSPPELIKNQGLKPVAVSPESEIKIEFKKEPNENTLGVSNWISDNEVDEVSLNDNVLIPPKEKGVYVYDVHARLEKGSSSYAFVIEVQ